jgi:flagellar hook-associated protein 1 FlgK
MALSTTSNNIANANTPGYNRQDVVLEISQPNAIRNGFVGTGVSVATIKSTFDRFIQAQLLGQQQNSGRSSTLSQNMSQIEQVFNEANGSGLSSSLTAYFNAWNDVASNPEAQAPRTVLLQKASTLISSAQRMESSIQQVLNQTNQGIDGAVAKINEIATNIATLNDQIVQIEGGDLSARANNLRDERDLLMNQLSNLVGNASYENDRGAITVTLGMRNLVEGTRTNLLSTTFDNSGGKQLYLDNTNITPLATNGQVGGMLASATEIQSDSLLGLRKLIASMTTEVNNLHRAGFGLDTSTNNNFFAPPTLTANNYSAAATITAAFTTPSLTGVTFDEYSIGFAAGNYTVTNNQTGGVASAGAYVSGNPIIFDGLQVTITGAVTAADTFTVSPLTDAIKNFSVALTGASQIAASSSLAQLPGNNTNARAIIQAASTAMATLGSGTFSEYYQGLVTQAGTLSRAAADSNTFDNNILTEIQTRRDSISGVSLDEEAANLIRFQRSYQAGAKIIQITDELIQTVLNL